jgi:hypothetical protein
MPGASDVKVALEAGELHVATASAPGGPADAG